MKISYYGMIYYISKQQSYFAILWEFNFHETSHLRSFAKIKLHENFRIFSMQASVKQKVKSVVRLTDRLEMTIAVDWGVKPQTKHIKSF